MRIFIVVSKDRPDLFRYFTAAFAGVETIEVILDRRLARDEDLSTVLMSPQQDRRAAPDIYDELQQRGFVIVQVPE